MAPAALHPVIDSSPLVADGIGPSKSTPRTANGSSGLLKELNASKFLFIKNQSPKTVPEPESEALKANNVCTDHMITAKWTADAGWEAPQLEPYGPLSLMPTASVLHYATECFEGLKLYRGFDGRLRLFRPARNAYRLRQSAVRIALPGFDPEEFLKLMVKLCAVDGPKWLPVSRAGHFLYLRPTMIGTADNLGVQKPREALLYVIACSLPRWDASVLPSEGAAGDEALDAKTSLDVGMKLLASNEDTVRAWPGGFGSAKLGSNYGPSLVAQAEARERGLDQVLWLLGKERLITEAGASNFFVVWRTRTGQVQLVTAPLHSKIILEGVTRASVLQLARERLASASRSPVVDGDGQAEIEALEVAEREYTIYEVEEAAREGRLVEAFVAGTAFFISPVSMIRHGDKDIRVPMGKGLIGPYAAAFKQWLWNIMYGIEAHEWGTVVDEEQIDA